MPSRDTGGSPPETRIVTGEPSCGLSHNLSTGCYRFWSARYEPVSHRLLL
eukprot:SAG11_NODE_11004_length_790_cov_1.062229_1_plen_49_part_10